MKCGQNRKHIVHGPIYPQKSGKSLINIRKEEAGCGKPENWAPNEAGEEFKLRKGIGNFRLSR